MSFNSADVDHLCGGLKPVASGTGPRQHAEWSNASPLCLSNRPGRPSHFLCRVDKDALIINCTILHCPF